MTRHRRRARTAAALAVVLTGLVGCSPEPATQRSPATVADTADWRPCPEEARQRYGAVPDDLSYDCASIDVPVDWSAGPAGGTLSLALVRARSTQQQDRIGSLVVNPGGPGVSGIDAALRLALGERSGGLPDEVLRRFDVVGFDPRGVSRSGGITCGDDADWDAVFGADPNPRDDAAFAEAVRVSQRIAASCAARHGDQLGAYSTHQTAQDLDAVRAAVGDDQLTYLGYSYGSLLGATYAHLFPDQVRALVLDGAIDPHQDPVTGSLGQAAGFERAFDAFARWCADAPRDCPISADPAGTLDEMTDRARQAPASTTAGRAATPGWIFYAVVASLYDESGWAPLARALAALRDGDPDPVFTLADGYTGRDPAGGYDGLFAANLAINCADAEVDLSTEQIRQLQQQWGQQHPRFGPALAVGLLACVDWPATADPYPVGPAAGAPPILVVGTTGDPATPYEQAPRLAELLGTGVLVTWDGNGHTAYPHADCVAAAVDAYLIDLTVPDDGLRCPA
ncbi:alpha/beta hydrolase [Micromonospora sp. NBC_01813]|uniref:alpha/beta hydrolase n=1 Tax=Micromonospora sp. NBC_01813 TaxID=2975988 RepID=UPI002DD98E77|nr:alpha/beta hydrolase [Micromonospora sp. NBC_01813]WSA11456.1 alpha/beta hydrolase [Micromonospora sp. NBC_01813]